MIDLVQQIHNRGAISSVLGFLSQEENKSSSTEPESSNERSGQ